MEKSQIELKKTQVTFNGMNIWVINNCNINLKKEAMYSLKLLGEDGYTTVTEKQLLEYGTLVKPQPIQKTQETFTKEEVDVLIKKAIAQTIDFYNSWNYTMVECKHIAERRFIEFSKANNLL